MQATTVRLLGVTLVWLTLGSGALGQLDNSERKCLDKMYNGSRKVLFKEQRFNRLTCVQYLIGDQTPCIDAERPQSVPKRADLATDFAAHCNFLPPFGVLGNPGAIADLAEKAADDVIREIWGNPVDGLDGSECARRLAWKTGRLAVEIWKEFRFCAKDLAAINSIEDIEQCIGVGISEGEADEGGNVDNGVNNYCVGLIPLPGTGDGKCGTETTTGGLANCLRNLVDCEVCLALSEVTGAVPDCDLLDDGLSNLSCGGPFLGVHQCAFNGASDGSRVDVCLSGACPFGPVPIAGAVDVDCGLVGAAEKASCTCSLTTVNPVSIPPLGVACIEPAAIPCGAGEVDCNGGNALDVNLLADHEFAGNCINDTDCGAACTTLCAGMGRSVFLSACEGICQEGIRDTLDCDCDDATAASCTTVGALDCPGGHCEGKDDERTLGDKDCHCQCIDTAAGLASPAGTVQCQMGTMIRFETALPCDETDVVLRLPPACAVLTSGTATQTMTAFEGSGYWMTDQTGSPLDCSDLSSSVTAGLDLVSNLPFLDGTGVDMSVHLRLDCQ